MTATVGDFEGLEPPVVVACSGGADSLALLVLAAEAGVHPVAVHVDHGLREGSAHEADVVAAAAAGLRVPFRSARVVLAPGPNLEARARAARHAVLERIRRELGASTVLTGHTADDQAETVLLNLLRGTGTTGLAGVHPRRGRLARPLLAVRRGEAREVCARHGLAPVEDPMNADPSFRRVLVRRELLPALARTARRDVVPLLARQAATRREESELLDDLATRALDDAGGDEPRAAELARLPAALVRRAVRVWLGSPPPSYEDVERVLTVVRGTARAAELTGGRRVQRAGGRLRVRNGAVTPARPGARVELPGVVITHGWRIETWIEREAPRRWPDGRWTGVLDAARAGDEARLVADGDRGVLVRPDGSELWRLGYGVGATARTGPTTRRFLWVTAESAAQPTGAPA
jgi:tRNA(Ile)-lysidine synthase